ncbi:MAG: hypothetical protein JOY67_05060, partial [Hyphomicrobiales bacterium]|nr:hypothetical protein [Hyphomicrobiales bacterium]
DLTGNPEVTALYSHLVDIIWIILYPNIAVALGVASVKVLIVAIWLCSCSWRNPFIRLVSAAGFLWFLVMFSLTFSDFVTR